jgi:chemotaxis-related protein WspB
MVDHSAKRNAPAQVADMLFLLFRIGQDRYALKATEIAEILPRVKLKAVAQVPHWVAGIFAHRGEIVPVIDISALNCGQPAQARTSTRMVLVHYRHDDRHPGQPPCTLSGAGTRGCARSFAVDQRSGTAQRARTGAAVSGAAT